MPTDKIHIDAASQPHVIPTGPAGNENAKLDAIDGSKDMILNAIPNTSRTEKFLLSSGLYPKDTSNYAHTTLEKKSPRLTYLPT